MNQGKEVGWEQKHASQCKLQNKGSESLFVGCTLMRITFIDVRTSAFPLEDGTFEIAQI